MRIFGINIGMGKTDNSIRSQVDFVGRESFALSNPGYDFRLGSNSDKYASIYPSIRAISYEFMKIRPYGIDANGEPVKDQRALIALNHPNQSDSAVAFRQKLATSVLVNRNTLILVHSRAGNTLVAGGDITPDNIAGYTFLEGYSKEIVNGKISYKRGATTFTDEEVISIPGGVYGYDLYAGYSAAEASWRWAKLDDYIADFQTGFFENNAIPAGVFIITAKTHDAFIDMKNTLEDRHRGAGNNNNVSYSFRPADDPNAPAQIEWIPFATKNKDIDFESTLSHIDKRIDTAFGVPAVIKGYDNSSTYATAQVQKQAFAEYTVDPFATLIYSQLTHELNRITGGLGFAFTYDYDIPAVADAEKVVAETQQIHANIITSMTLQGYSVSDIVDAFELPASYKTLTEPAQAKTETNEAEGDGSTEKAPKVEQGVSFRLEAKEPTFRSACEELMDKQIENAIKALDEPQDVDYAEDQDMDEFIEAMLVVALLLILSSGEEQYDLGTALVLASGATDEMLSEFKITDNIKSNYRSVISKIGESYGSDTASSIQKVLLDAETNQLTRSEINKKLRNIKQLDDWRIDRIARTETNRSSAIGSVESMNQLTAETGIEFEKSLFHSEGPECEFCKAQEDIWYDCDQPMILDGGQVEGVDGGILKNTFGDNIGSGLHPNCHGVPTFRIKE